MARVSGKKLIHLFHPFCPTQRTWNWTIIWEWLGCDAEIIFKNDESVFEKTWTPGHTHLRGVWFPRCLEVSTRQQHWRRGIPVLICACFSAWVVRQHIYCIMLFQKHPLHGQEVPVLQETCTLWFEWFFFLFQRSDSIWLAHNTNDGGNPAPVGR